MPKIEVVNDSLILKKKDEILSGNTNKELYTYIVNGKKDQ